MSLYNVNSYNIDIAKSIGVLSAIYVSFIDKLLIRNEKLTLSKNQIYDYTGIDYDKQDEVENNLIKCGIMDIKGPRTNSNKKSYLINYDRLEELLKNPDKINEVYVFTTMLKKPKEKVSIETKKEQNLKKLKSAVKIDDEVLKQHIFDWIDSVIDGGKFLTQQSVKINIEQLNKFTSSQDTAIQVVDMSAKNCWRDLEWAMNKISPEIDNKNNFANYSNIISNGKDFVEEAF